MSEWHKGPPPSVGWWIASIEGSNPDMLRWWDGRCWSVAVQDTSKAKFAGRQAMLRSIAPALIKWQHRPASWPERSRT